MKKIVNPFIKLTRSEEYSCFGCSPSNQNGLKMEFHEEGDEIVSFWTPDKRFEGFHNVLHGGIQATLIDEIASWVVFVKLKTGGFTSELNVKYLKSVMIDKGRIALKASLRDMEKNIAHISVSLYDGEGSLCSEGVASYFTLPEKIAAHKLKYPGIESFYE
ncbi:MAG: PaaI family thioesterase [Spirochaetales bacterium]|nr:PaaI family thioesterase [Spirochaetales bacterium]